MLESTTDFNAYVGNGAVDEYSYSFKVFLATHLLVTVRDTSDVESTLVIDVDYTVDGAGDTSGGTITLLAGNLTTDYTLVIRRNVELLQETDIRNQGDFFAEVHEDFFDYIMMIAQQLLSLINKAFKLPETVTGVDTELPVPVALKWWRWDATGTALEQVDAADLSIVTTVGPDLTLASSNLSITIPNRQGVAGGTVDAITTTFSPVIAALANNVEGIVEAAGANTGVATFAPDGLDAKTMVKENDVDLVAGDIPGANFRMHLVFDATLDKWVLLNPNPLGLAGGTMTGAIVLVTGSAAAPAVGWTDTGFYESTANEIGISCSGAIKWNISATAFIANNTNGPALQNEASSITNPTLCPDKADVTAGWGGTSGDLSAIIGGAEIVRVVASGVTVQVAAASPPVANTLSKGSICKAWVALNGSGTIAIKDSVNVSGIVDNGVGNYTVTIDTDMADGNFSAVGSQNAANGSVNIGNHAAGSCIVQCVTMDGSAAANDPTHVSVQIFGAQ
jgi:hypothetical protein